jgi:integrase
MPKMRQLVDNSPIPINEMDIEKFKEQISKKDPQLWLASQFIFYCFIRPGTELRLMKIRWIDFSRKIITIPGEFSKNGKVQPIVVPGHFMKLLIEEYYLNKYDLDFYVFSLYGRPGETPLGKNTLRNRFNSHRDNLGLSKDYKFYSWKHTGARAASDAGIPVKDIQMQMRHHSLDVTDKYLRKLKGFESEALKNRFPTI